MWLVKRSSLQKVRIIPDEIKTALRRYFIENQLISSYQKQAALKLLQEAHENGYWLACDCLANVAEPPLMYVRRFETGQLSLVRMPNRTAHLATCGFKFTENPVYSHAKSSGQIKSWDKTSALNLHHTLQTELVAAVEKTDETSKATASHRIPRLGRLLYTLLQEARLTKIKANMPNISEQFNLFKKLASQYFLANKIAMTDFLWTFPTQTGFAAVQLKNSQSQWPDAIRPYGIFILLVERFENNIAYCAARGELISIELNGNLVFSSGRLSESSGPFLLIATFTDAAARPGSFVMMNGFAIPVYANYLLVPVESNYERRVLQKLLQLIQVFRKKDVTLIVEKPLFDIAVKGSSVIDSCRPDFLLKTKEKTIVLEVMGSEEEAYQERKLRTHSIMERLGPLLIFNAVEADKSNQWDEKLDELCRKIYRVML
jgi:hypothetical protein